MSDETMRQRVEVTVGRMYRCDGGEWQEIEDMTYIAPNAVHFLQLLCRWNCQGNKGIHNYRYCVKSVKPAPADAELTIW